MRQEKKACIYNIFIIYFMKIWTFKIFVNQNNDVDGWIRNLSTKARARLDAILRHMGITKDWTRTPYFSPLTGYRGIYEIKFIVQNTQYRPLGCYGLGKNEFTILIGAWEIGDRFEPLDAPEMALTRRQEVFEGRGYTVEYY